MMIKITRASTVYLQTQSEMIGVPRLLKLEKREREWGRELPKINRGSRSKRRSRRRIVETMIWVVRRHSNEKRRE